MPIEGYQQNEERENGSISDVVGEREIEWVDIDSLVLGESPRTTGLSPEHVRLLAESDAPVPPILLQRGTRRVVDGHHRVEAARMRGETAIPAKFFDGDEDDVFLMAVQMNKAHGLPLTLAEREAAAIRIIASRPHYSDRSIAAIAGLSGKTVGAIRRRTMQDDRSQVRLGSDGRSRPTSTADARRVAAQAIAEHPNASLRQIARMAGVSPGTVRDVRERLRRGEEPVPDRQRTSLAAVSTGTGTVSRVPAAGSSQALRDRDALLHSLMNDPTLKFTESGRSLLRWLYAHAAGLDEWPDLIGGLPPHCAYTLVELARSCSAQWDLFAVQLEGDLRKIA